MKSVSPLKTIGEKSVVLYVYVFLLLVSGIPASVKIFLFPTTFHHSRRFDCTVLPVQ